MIRYKDFIIKSNGYERYDLYRNVRVKKDKDKERYREEAIAYAQPFANVLRDILIILTDEKCQKEEIDSLQGYIDTIQQVMNELKTIKI
jgi:hypothetical protein